MPVLVFVGACFALSLLPAAYRASLWVRRALADQSRREDRIWHMAEVWVVFGELQRAGYVRDETCLAELVELTGHGVDVVLDALLPVPGPSALAPVQLPASRG
ncbi:MAG TPA: hypothetical protein VMU09_09680 [Acidimicrobiales bacterium]|nr:hypothetical protein [Acidimicrobiales bacterium]